MLGQAEKGYWPFENEVRGRNIKYVEVSLISLLYGDLEWPGRDELLVYALEHDMDEETTFIFLGTGSLGEKHADIVARALDIDPIDSSRLRCRNAGKIELGEDGVWLVGSSSFGLNDERGRPFGSLLYIEKNQLDIATAGKLGEIYRTERSFAAGIVE